MPTKKCKKIRPINWRQVGDFFCPNRRLGLGAFITASGHISVDMAQDSTRVFEPEEIEEIAQAAEKWAIKLRELASEAKQIRDQKI